MKFLSVIFITFSLTTFGADFTWHPRVQLSVSGKEQLSAEMGSYVRRELRSLGDVVLTDVNPDYRIGILVRAVPVGSSTYYISSTLITQPFDSNVLCWAHVTNSASASVLTSFCTNYVTVALHQLRGLADLRQLSAQIVADFDSEHLEPVRKAITANSESKNQSTNLLSVEEFLNNGLSATDSFVETNSPPKNAKL